MWHWRQLVSRWRSNSRQPVWSVSPNTHTPSPSLTPACSRMSCPAVCAAVYVPDADRVCGVQRRQGRTRWQQQQQEQEPRLVRFDSPSAAAVGCVGTVCCCCCCRPYSCVVVLPVTSASKWSSCSVLSSACTVCSAVWVSTLVSKQCCEPMRGSW